MKCRSIGTYLGGMLLYWEYIGNAQPPASSGIPALVHLNRASNTKGDKTNLKHLFANVCVCLCVPVCACAHKLGSWCTNFSNDLAQSKVFPFERRVSNTNELEIWTIPLHADGYMIVDKKHAMIANIRLYMSRYFHYLYPWNNLDTIAKQQSSKSGSLSQIRNIVARKPIASEVLCARVTTEIYYRKYSTWLVIHVKPYDDSNYPVTVRRLK